MTGRAIRAESPHITRHITPAFADYLKRSPTVVGLARTVRPAGWPRIDSRLAILGIVLATAAAGGTVAWFSDREPSSTPRPVRRHAFQPAVSIGWQFALSPDGTGLVYSAGRPLGLPLHFRSLDELEPKPIPGTEGAKIPFFSPDGQWIAFSTTGRDQLKKVRTAGGAVITLADVRDMMQGAWGPNGQIVIAQREQGLMTVSEEGGPLVPLTSPDIDAGEIDHHSPTFLPDGRAHGQVAARKREIIREALRRYGGNVAAAARELDLQVTYLHRRIRNLEIRT